MYKLLLIFVLLTSTAISEEAPTPFELGLVDLNKYTEVEVKNHPYGHPAFIWLLGRMKEKTKIWRITEGYPPTVRHSSINHRNGRALDLTLRDGRKAEEICNWINGLADFKCINEYKKKTRYRTGNHLHISYEGI